MYWVRFVRIGSAREAEALIAASEAAGWVDGSARKYINTMVALTWVHDSKRYDEKTKEYVEVYVLGSVTSRRYLEETCAKINVELLSWNEIAACIDVPRAIKKLLAAASDKRPVSAQKHNFVAVQNTAEAWALVRMGEKHGFVMPEYCKQRMEHPVAVDFNVQIHAIYPVDCAATLAIMRAEAVYGYRELRTFVEIDDLLREHAIVPEQPGTKDIRCGHHLFRRLLSDGSLLHVASGETVSKCILEMIYVRAKARARRDAMFASGAVYAHIANATYASRLNELAKRASRTGGWLGAVPTQYPLCVCIDEEMRLSPYVMPLQGAHELRNWAEIESFFAESAEAGMVFGSRSVRFCPGGGVQVGCVMLDWPQVQQLHDAFYSA